MFCENCGSAIPDGARFCTECGARIAAPAGDVPDVVLPDIPEVILPDIPDIPDVILPGAPVIPDISRSVLHSGEEPAPENDAAEPAWSVPAQGAASYEPVVPPSDTAYRPVPTDEGGASGWSVPGSEPVSVPIRSEAPAAKPLCRRWWFWLIMVVGVALFALVIVAALLIYSLRNTMPPTEPPAEILQSILDEADIPDIDIPDIDIPDIGDLTEPDGGAFPLDADDQHTPLELLVDQIDRTLTDMDLEHDVWSDEDGWVFADIWTDDVDKLAEAAFNGDEASLAEWNALTENIRALSGDFSAGLQDGGQYSSPCIVSLMDDVDRDLSLAVAIDGELIFDLVTGIDEYGILEE